MKPPRVDCANCANFKFPDFKISFGIIKLKPEEKESCKLGKRVIFRTNGLHPESATWEAGWFRFCNDFKQHNNESRK